MFPPHPGRAGIINTKMPIPRVGTTKHLGRANRTGPFKTSLIVFSCSNNQCALLGGCLNFVTFSQNNLLLLIGAKQNFRWRFVGTGNHAQHSHAKQRNQDAPGSRMMKFNDKIALWILGHPVKLARNATVFNGVLPHQFQSESLPIFQMVCYSRFSALSTALIEASSMLVSTPAPHLERPSAARSWM